MGAKVAQRQFRCSEAMFKLFVKTRSPLLAIGFALWCANAQAGTLFQPAQLYDSGGRQSFSVAVADLNHDGNPDIVVASQCFVSGPCNYNEGDNGAVSVLLSTGDGKFAPAQTYYSGGGTAYSVTVADVNGDGNPDILVVNACVGVNKCGSGVVGVLLGKGDGTFQPAQSYGSGGVQPFPITVADVNGDGKPDIVAGNACVPGCGSSVVGLLLGNGDGTFQSALSIDPGGLDPESLAVKDVNGDGKADLVIANVCFSAGDCSGSVSVLFGNGDGTFQAAQTYLAGGYAGRSVLIADVNGDGKSDLVVANADISGSDNLNGVVGVLLGNGDGTFQSAQTYNTGAFDTNNVAIADVNGDSIPDLVTSNSCHSTKYGSSCGSGAVGVLLGKGDGTFGKATIYSAGGVQSKLLAVADLNHDGRPDVVIVNVCSSGQSCANGSVGVLFNVGKFETSTMLSSSLNPSTYGQKVTLTAKVNSIGPQEPTGRVTFRSGTTAVGSAVLSNGVASLTKNNLPSGTLAITATYSGDAQSGKSVSTVLAQSVNQASSTTSIKSSLNPSMQGQAVTFTAKVTSPTAKVTGTVTFVTGTTTLGTVTLTAGKASITTTSLPVGSNTVTANYNGTPNIVGSSGSLIQIVD